MASRYYKGPELLVNYVYYGYSLDIWSTGVLMASIIFQKDPFFKGADDQDQLVQIVKVLGSSDFYLMMNKYKIKVQADMEARLDKIPKVPFQAFITKENQHLCSEEALDLLSQMLLYDPSERITPKDAMKHKYFNQIHE